MNAAELIMMIENGDYDADLAAIANACSMRQTRTRTEKTKDDFAVGDAIVLNPLCGSKGLIGMTGVVVGKAQKKLKITLDHPAGTRFVRYVNGEPKSAVISVPPVIIDKVQVPVGV